MQIGLSGAIYLAAVAAIVHFTALRPTPSLTIPALSQIGSVLALVGSASFAFVLFHMNFSTSRKNDSFYRFRTCALEFDRIIESGIINPSLRDATRDVGWKLSGLKQDDFPIDNWDEILESLAPHLSVAPTAEDPDAFAKERLLNQLGHIEDLHNDIATMFIRQIVVGLYASFVGKVFAALGGLLLVTAIAHFMPAAAFGAWIGALPAFFAPVTTMLLAEGVGYLKREADELVPREAEHKDDKDDGA